MAFNRSPFQIALRKRAEALASIERHRRDIARLEARVAEQIVIIDAHGGLPKRKPGVIAFRASGEVTRQLFDMLRERVPDSITSDDLAARLLAFYGLPADDPAIAHAMRQRVIRAIRKAVISGYVQHVGGNGKRKNFKRWQLVVLRNDPLADQVL